MLKSATPQAAMILAAGKGTRMRPITDKIPKPLVEVGGMTLLDRILDHVERAGIGHVVVNAFHLGKKMAAHLEKRKEPPVKVLFEEDLLDTGGGVRNALGELGPGEMGQGEMAKKPFFVINGDSLTDLDLARMRTAHEARGAAVTMAMMSNPAPERYGGATVDQDGWVEGFVPPGKGSPFHFVGVQLMEASVLASVPKGQPAETIGGVYDTLLAEQPRSVYAHVVDTRFHDIGTPRDYLATSLAFAATDGHVTCPIGERSVVHPTAILTRTAVWDEVLIGEGCRLTECVVTDHAVLPPYSVFERQAIVSAEGRAPRDHERQLGDLLLTPIDGRPLKG